MFNSEMNSNNYSKVLSYSTVQRAFQANKASARMEKNSSLTVAWKKQK